MNRRGTLERTVKGDRAREVIRAVGAVVVLGMLASGAVEAQTPWIDFLDATGCIEAPDSAINDAPCGDPSTCDPPQECSSSCPAACACEKDIAFEDLDGDGDTDMVIVRKFPFFTPGKVPNLLFMNEDGTLVDKTAQFAPGFLDPTDDRDVVIEDIDGDLINTDLNMPDVITAGTFGEPPRVYINLGCCDTSCDPHNPCPAGNKVPCDTPGSTWCGLRYDPAENRIPQFQVQGEGLVPCFCAVAAGDVDGDGCRDLYFGEYNDALCNDALNDRLLMNIKDAASNRCIGVFTDETSGRLTADMAASGFATSVDIVDINRDVHNDIVKTETLPLAVQIFYNDGAGSFTSPQLLDLANGIYAHATGDMNRDQSVDVYGVSGGQDSYWINRCQTPGSPECVPGSVQFTLAEVTNSDKTMGQGGNTRLVDLDRDAQRLLDAVVSDNDQVGFNCVGRLALLQTVIVGDDVIVSDPLNAEVNPWNTVGTFDTGVFDVDGDLKPDLWSGTCSGNRLFIQAGSAPDCNANGAVDACDIASGTSADANANGIPDDCETGACCNASLSCQSDVLGSVCTAGGGGFLVEQLCMGALPGPANCCMPDGSCVNTFFQDCCEAMGGTLDPFSESCQPAGACCLSDGTCIDTTAFCCDQQGGTFMASTSCGSGVVCFGGQ